MPKLRWPASPRRHSQPHGMLHMIICQPMSCDLSVVSSRSCTPAACTHKSTPCTHRTRTHLRRDASSCKVRRRRLQRRLPCICHRVGRRHRGLRCPRTAGGRPARRLVPARGSRPGVGGSVAGACGMRRRRAHGRHQAHAPRARPLPGLRPRAREVVAGWSRGRRLRAGCATARCRGGCRCSQASPSPLCCDRGAGKAAWRHAADRLARAVRDVRGPRLHRGPSPWLASCAQGTGRLLERLLQRRRTGPRGCGPRRRGSFHACFCCAGRRGGGRSRRRRLCVAAAGPSAAHGTGICLGACRRWRRRGKGRWLDHGPAGCERGSGVIVSARQLRGRHPAPIRSLQLAAAGCSAAELSGVRACTSGRGGGDSIGRLPGTGAARQATVQPAGDCVFAGSRRRCGCPGSRRRRAAARWRGALRCADVRAEACSVPAGSCGHRSGRVVAGIGAARLAGAGGQRARGRRRGCQRADERHGARVGARGAALAHGRARQRPAGDGRRGVDQVRPCARQVGVRGEAGRRLRRRAPQARHERRACQALRGTRVRHRKRAFDAQWRRPVRPSHGDLGVHPCDHDVRAWLWSGGAPGAAGRQPSNCRQAHAGQVGHTCGPSAGVSGRSSRSSPATAGVGRLFASTLCAT